MEMLASPDLRGGVAVFTGAGVSTLCGIPDFRGPDGLYRDPMCEKMFDIDVFLKDPEIFYRNASDLVYGNSETRPGPVHLAVKKLQDGGIVFGVATQNIDGLHERAGSCPVYAVHGTAAVHHCCKCGMPATFDEICVMRAKEMVPHCKCGGVFKPDITFFGESLPADAFDGAVKLAESCRLMLVLGTSLSVTPASLIPQYALRAGAELAIINATPTCLDRHASYLGRSLEEFASYVNSEDFPGKYA